MKSHVTKLLFLVAVVTVTTISSCKPRVDGTNSGLKGTEVPGGLADERTIQSIANIAKDHSAKNLTYYNMNPADPKAKRGLELIMAGRALAPMGVPKSAFTTLRKNFKAPDMADDWARWQNYGLAPSPSQRIEGMDHGIGDLGLGMSTQTVSLCKDSFTSKMKLSRIPVDEFSNITFCDVKTSKADIIGYNCLNCHTNVVGDSVVVGASNSHVDQYAAYAEGKGLSKFFDTTVRGQGFYEKTIGAASSMATKLYAGVKLSKFEVELARDWNTHFSRITLPILKWANTRGENFATYMIFRYVSQVPTPGDGFSLLEEGNNAAADKAFNNGNLRLGTHDPQAWYLFKFKKSVTWYDEAHLLAKDFVVGFQASHQGAASNHRGHVDLTENVLHYVKSVHSPRYPWKIDFDLVEKGRKIFHEQQFESGLGTVTCSSCHGLYKHEEPASFKWAVTYPGEMGTSVVMETDKTYVKAMSYAQDVVRTHSQAVIGDISKLYTKAEQDHYIPEYKNTRAGTDVTPPPLVGLWSSAPYFHNGSIPTVFQVLKAKQRPKIWTRVLRTDAYNQKNLGMVYAEDNLVSMHDNNGKPITYTEANKKRIRDNIDGYSSEESRSLRLSYDTSEPGKGIMGHDFVQDWSDEDVYAVVEFLKSVSGPEVLPAK